MSSNTPIPDSWAEVPLGSLAEKITKGSTPTTYGYSFQNSGINFLKVENVKGGVIDLGSVIDFISDEANENQEKSQLSVNDILFSIAGTIGEITIIKEIHLPANTNQAFAIISEYDSALSPKFLEHQLRSFVTQRTKSKARGGAMNNVSLGDLKKLGVFVSPLNEQHRIVAKIEALFSELDKGIESLNTAREQLKAYRQALLKHAFEGKLTEQWRKDNADKLETAEQLLQRIKQERETRYQQQLEDWQAAVKQWEVGGKEGKKPSKPKTFKFIDSIEYDSPTLPNGWCWSVIGSLFNVVSGNTPKGINLAQGKDIPFYKISDMNTVGNELKMSISAISLSTEEMRDLGLQAYPKGTIIFPKRGGAILTNKKRLLSMRACFDLNTMGVVNDLPSVSNEYLWHWFSVLDLAKIYDGSSVPQINNKNIEPLCFPLCSISEQTEICTRLEQRLSAVDVMKKEIEESLLKSESLRQSLLKKAFSGQLVPQDANDEPASVLLERIAKTKAAKKKTDSRRAS